MRESLGGSLNTLPPSLQGGRRLGGGVNPWGGAAMRVGVGVFVNNGTPDAEWDVAWERVDAEVPPWWWEGPPGPPKRLPGRVPGMEGTLCGAMGPVGPDAAS